MVIWPDDGWDHPHFVKGLHALNLTNRSLKKPFLFEANGGETTVDGSEIPRPTIWDVHNPVKHGS